MNELMKQIRALFASETAMCHEQMYADLLNNNDVFAKICAQRAACLEGTMVKIENIYAKVKANG